MTTHDGVSVGARPGQEPERVRTDLHCHECDGDFLAVIDLALTGNHIIHCPHCGHEHCRLVVNGRVTEERWSSRHGRIDVAARDTIALRSQPVTSGTAAAFLRDRWLNRG